MEKVELPNAWAEVPFGTVLTAIVGGGTPSKDNANYYKGKIPWMSVKDMNKDVLTDTKDHITQEAVENSSTNIVPAGTPIIATRMSLGKIVTASFDTAINQDLKALFHGEYIDRSFLVYWYRSVGRKVEELGTGTTVKGIRLEVLRNLTFSVAPLAEQKAIAGKLDTLLAQVETTKSRLDRIPDILKRFRQSVLAAAVSGKLTEEWRGDAELNGWEMIKLGAVVDSIEAGKNLKCIEAPPKNNELGIIKISAVTWGFYDENQSKTLPSTELFLESRRIKIGDFLISRANTLELLGNPVVVQKVSKNLMLSDKVWRLLMDESDKPWVSIFLRSGEGRKEIESRSTGNQMSMRNISQKALLDIDIPQVPAKEKSEIVNKVTSLLSFADAIEQQCRAAQERVNSLTQSLLAKAFRGELTADWRAANPELISGENSAKVLLLKIKAEREAAKPIRMKKKNT